MSQQSADPLPTVPEDRASGRTAEIFADIRAATGIPMVKLVWRHLAAWALRQDLALPPFDSPGVTALEAAGVGPAARADIDAVLHSYERGNAQNLVALSSLVTAADAVAAPLPAAPDRAELEDVVTRALPPLPALCALPADLLTRVQALGRIGAPADDWMVPGAYRHLCLWSAYLTAVCPSIERLGADGDPLARAVQAALADGRSRAAALLAPGDRAPPADRAVRERVEAAADRFVRTMIGRMVVIVPLLRRGLRAGRAE